jgi:hypothetical protein
MALGAYQAESTRGNVLNAAVDDYGRVIPTINVYAQPQQAQAPLNQANPNTTYVSPNTPQPTGATPVAGQTDTQSGQPVRATYNMPPAPDTATAARNYRLRHGLATADDSAATDALNAESLAAAQAGRTSFNPTLAAQYGQPQAAGVYGPRTDVVNALSAPPAASQVAQAQPTVLTQPSALTMPTTSRASLAQNLPTILALNNLLRRGIY